MVNMGITKPKSAVFVFLEYLRELKQYHGYKVCFHAPFLIGRRHDTAVVIDQWNSLSGLGKIRDEVCVPIGAPATPGRMFSSETETFRVDMVIRDHVPADHNPLASMMNNFEGFQMVGYARAVSFS